MAVDQFYARILINGLHSGRSVARAYKEIAAAYDYVQVKLASALIEDPDDIIPVRVFAPVLYVLQVYLVLYPVVEPFDILVDLVRYDAAVPKADYPVGIEFSQILFMRNEYDQLLARDSFDDVHYLESIGTVEVSRRLVGDDYGRILDYRPCYAYPLPLSAGEHIGIAFSVAVHTNKVERIVYLLPYLFLVLYSHHPEHHGHIVEYGHAVNEVVILEDISYVEVSDLIHGAGSAPREFLPVYIYLSPVGLIESAYYIQESRLAAAGRSQKSRQSALAELKRSIIYYVYLVRLAAVKIFIYIL